MNTNIANGVRELTTDELDLASGGGVIIEYAAPAWPPGPTVAAHTMYPPGPTMAANMYPPGPGSV